MKSPPPNTRGQSKLTPKRAKFARAVVETGEYTKAYRQAFNAENMLPSSVHREAAATSRIPVVRAEIARLLAPHTTVDNILRIHTRNMEQREHLPTSQRAVESYEEILGIKSAAQAPSVSVAFVINRQNGVEVSSTAAPLSAMDTLPPTHNESKIIDPPDREEGVGLAESE